MKFESNIYYQAPTDREGGPPNDPAKSEQPVQQPELLDEFEVPVAAQDEKTAAFQDGQPLSPENLRSLEVANEKLAKLMQENFLEYGVRFVSEEEYMAIIQGQRLDGTKEIYVPNANLIYDQLDSPDYDPRRSNKTISFTKFVQKGYGQWPFAAADMTDWEYSVQGLKTEIELLWEFRNAHKNAKKMENDDKRSIREKTISEFDKKIKSEHGAGLRGGPKDLLEELVEWDTLPTLMDSLTQMTNPELVESIDEIIRTEITKYRGGDDLIYELEQNIQTSISEN